MALVSTVYFLFVISLFVACFALCTHQLVHCIYMLYVDVHVHVLVYAIRMYALLVYMYPSLHVVCLFAVFMFILKYSYTLIYGG